MAPNSLKCLSEAMSNLRICARNAGATVDAAAALSGAHRSRQATNPTPYKHQRISSLPFRRFMATEASLAPPIASIPRGKLPPLPSTIKPVPLTIHRFPSLEPVRLELWSKKHIDVPFRRDLLHLAVVYEGDCSRGVSTVRVKTRWEVTGSKRKIRPQKGMGMARVRDRYSPLHRGGGKVFGPRPKDWSTKMNRKQYDLAWRVALSHRYRSGELVVVENELDFEISDHFKDARSRMADTLVDQFLEKHTTQMMKRMGFGQGKTLFITTQKRDSFFEAVEKIPRIGRALDVEDVDIKDFLAARRVVIERPALVQIIEKRQNDLRTDVKFADGSRRMPPALGQPLLVDLAEAVAAEAAV